MVTSTRHSRRAFTLLEVVVTFAVLALAGAVIIPQIMKFRARMGDVTCQNNLRQLSRALQMYNNDNNGSMPYGFYYENSDPVTWQPVGGNTHYISWASELNKYFNPPPGTYAEAFQCPQALQQSVPHRISYVMNFIVGVSPVNELVMGPPPRAQTKPPNLHLMRTEGTALFWDTAIPLNTEGDGYLTGADVDDQRFWRGARSPQFRYFDPYDVYWRIPPGVYGNNKPVVFGFNYRNIDPTIGSYPYQGNLRFRHEDQTQCNAAFSDGSVRRFTAVVQANGSIQSHDALRRYFMIHWPPGVTRDTSVP